MIVGIKQFERILDKMSLVDLHKAVSRSIHLVQSEAKMQCPVHDGELRASIYTDTKFDRESETVSATCYTNKEYAPYVEFGTGPKGQANHEGVSPEIAIYYTQSPWWIHESQIDARIADTYHWFFIDTPQGRFYQCTGQAAQPFLYPALKNQEEEIERIFAEGIMSQL